jgi:hypothetical protein
MEASKHTIDLSLLKSWPPGVRWGHNRGNCFYICLIYRKHFSKLLNKNHCQKKESLIT